MTADKIDEHKQKNHTCCFTGHRPQKLHLPENEVRSLLKKLYSKQFRMDSQFLFQGWLWELIYGLLR